MAAQGANKGKKKSKDKMPLEEFSQLNVPQGHSVVSVKVTGLDWAATMASYNQESAATRQVIVPTAPRAQREDEIDGEPAPSDSHNSFSQRGGRRGFTDGGAYQPRGYRDRTGGFEERSGGFGRGYQDRGSGGGGFEERSGGGYNRGFSDRGGFEDRPGGYNRGPQDRGFDDRPSGHNQGGGGYNRPGGYNQGGGGGGGGGYGGHGGYNRGRDTQGSNTGYGNSRPAPLRPTEIINDPNRPRLLVKKREANAPVAALADTATRSTIFGNAVPRELVIQKKTSDQPPETTTS